LFDSWAIATQLSVPVMLAVLVRAIVETKVTMRPVVAPLAVSETAVVAAAPDFAVSRPMFVAAPVSEAQVPLVVMLAMPPVEFWR